MGARRRARELALRVLFHLEYSPGDPEAAFELLCGNFHVPEEGLDFARGIVLGVTTNLRELDRLIREASRNWRLERMSRVDRNILRMAAYELVFAPDIPPRAAMDEAVELGKRYGSEDSAAFINGVLDHIYKKRQEVPEQ
jgi:N utilization substance protein B